MNAQLLSSTLRQRGLPEVSGSGRRSPAVAGSAGESSMKDSSAFNTKSKSASAEPELKQDPPVVDDVQETRSETLVGDFDVSLERLEATLASWEKVGYDFFDKKREAAYQFLTHLRNDVMSTSRAKAEEVVTFVDKNLGPGTHDFAGKVLLGVHYFEQLVKEESHTFQLAVSRAKEKLLTLEELPKAWVDNPYITRGYRFCQSPWECVESIVHIHNETCNIWTHLLGAVMMIGIGVFHLPQTETWQNGSWMDRLPMIVFVAAAVKCLFCSVAWHTFSNIAMLRVKKRMACVDYVGITILITASIMTTEYSVLYCHPIARSFYMLVTLVSGAAGSIFASNPKFDSVEARPIRALFFVSFALAGALGGVHAATQRGWSETLGYYLPVIKSLAAYGVGVVFYALLIPERWAPRSLLNFVGASHNIWHLFVLAGIYYHYKAMVTIFEQARHSVCF